MERRKKEDRKEGEGAQRSGAHGNLMRQGRGIMFTLLVRRLSLRKVIWSNSHKEWSWGLNPSLLIPGSVVFLLQKLQYLSFFVFLQFSSVQFSSFAQSCPTLCNPMNRSTPGLPVHHQLPEFTQTHVHRVGDAIQPSHPLLSPSPPAPDPSQHQSLFQWVNSSHEVAKVLEFQLWHQSFQRNSRTDLL